MEHLKQHVADSMFAEPAKAAIDRASFDHGNAPILTAEEHASLRQRLFGYAHLPPALQPVSAPFFEAAARLGTLPQLLALFEAKNLMVVGRV